MRITECLPLDEIFTHIDEDDGTVRHINASAMARAVASLLSAGRVTQIDVWMDPEFVEYTRNRRGLEEWKLKRLCEPYLSRPLIGIDWPDGSVLLVDGHHRLVTLADKGLETYSMYRFPIGEWEVFLVEMPMGMSDMLALDTLSCAK